MNDFGPYILDELLCRKCGHGITNTDDLTSVPTRKALRQRNDTVSEHKNTLIQLFENPEGKFLLILYKLTQCPNTNIAHY